MAPAPEIEDEDAGNALQNALADFEKASRTPPKLRPVKINASLDKLCAKAYENGLPSESLDRLVDIITLPNDLDQATTNAVIKNLYPAEKVPDGTVLKVVGSLGHGVAKISFPAQAALLKWLVMVYDVLENQKVLSSVYGVFFNLLDTVAIRGAVCHLLSLVTRRKHVRPFRIQHLLELCRQTGNEPPLIGLLRVYKDYYPDVIVGDVTGGRATVFTHPNPEWRQRLGDIQEAHFQRNQDAGSGQGKFRVVRRGVNGVKRSKISVVPEVHTSRAQETSVTLEEIDNVDHFVQRLEKIELPNQLVAVMGDPLLQKLLQLKGTPSTIQRVDCWLMAFFQDRLEDNDVERILAMLDSILEYVRFSKRLPDACLTYLKSLLGEWDGITGRSTILGLLSYVPIQHWETLYKSILTHLETAIIDTTVESQTTLLTFYASLLQNWTTTLLSYTTASPPIPVPPHATRTISHLTTHANTLALNILECTPSLNTTTTHPSILTFYERTVHALSLPTLLPHLRITTPRSPLIYQLHITPSLTTLSRLCSILASYKRALETAMSAKPPPSATTYSTTPAPPSQQYDKGFVNHFNGFLMDICNSLWRARAFNKSDTNALGCLLPDATITSLTNHVHKVDSSLQFSALFSLSYNPALCALSIAYVRDLEDEELGKEDEEGGLRERQRGPVTQKSLQLLGQKGGVRLSWPEYRLGVLRYLEERGVEGVGELMYNTMKHLMEKGERRGGAGGRR